MGKMVLEEYEKKNYGQYVDTSVADTISRIFKGYFNYNKVSARYNIVAADIIDELEKGNVVVVPAIGRELNNPNFRGTDPFYHMLVVKGYDYKTKQFITNDPGTRNGQGYRYSEATLMNAISDYPTGNNAPMGAKVKAMIVVTK